MATNLAVKHNIPAPSAFTVWSDEALVAWVIHLQGDKSETMNELLGRYRPWIVQRCRFRLSNEDDAQDVAQQVAMRVFRSIHQLKESAGFKAWLSRIIDNCCKTYGAQRGRYITSIGEQLEIEGAEDSDELKYIEAREIVVQVLAQLPDTARQVLLLRFYDEYSLEQIAQHLALKLSATKARLYRALRQFRDLYIEMP